MKDTGPKAAVQIVNFRVEQLTQNLQTGSAGIRFHVKLEPRSENQAFVFTGNFNSVATLKIPVGDNKIVPIPGGRILTRKNDTEREVGGIERRISPAALLTDVLITGGTNLLKLEDISSTHATTVDLWKDFIGMNKVWEFRPPIPADGTFSADLTLTYDDSDLPDDPNFVERCSAGNW
ncbi:MAG: hypothetical protein HY644_14255 [Acidobacteria bacterium]|nr:hypothetical protein [Acidobacteriota bacterium]